MYLKKRLTFFCVFDILHIVGIRYSTCGSAGIGRQARLRILWVYARVGSSPISRSKDKKLKYLISQVFQLFLCLESNFQLISSTPLFSLFPQRSPGFYTMSDNPLLLSAAIQTRTEKHALHWLYFLHKFRQLSLREPPYKPG